MFLCFVFSPGSFSHRRLLLRDSGIAWHINGVVCSAQLTPARRVHVLRFYNLGQTEAPCSSDTTVKLLHSATQAVLFVLKLCLGFFLVGCWGFLTLLADNEWIAAGVVHVKCF